MADQVIHLKQNVVDVKDASSNKTYGCPFQGCKSVFNRPYRLAQHRLTHVNVRPFRCQAENCKKAYTSKSHLDRHFKNAHKQTELEILFCCPICMKKYANRQNLKRHMKVNHSKNSNTFICDHCKALFKKKTQLEAHMFQHTGVKSFRCSLCTKDFISPYARRKHMRNHKTYKCEHCTTEFPRYRHLLAHKRTEHRSQVSEYVCNDCGATFNKRIHIIQHVRRHQPNNAQSPVFYCTYENCLRRYSRNSNLKQHILVKHKGLTFNCTVCGAGLSTKARLNDHIERHFRAEGIPRTPKTLEHGRKKRKDENSTRIMSAVKLAGLVKVEMENRIKKTHNNNSFQEEMNDSYSDTDQPD